MPEDYRFNNPFGNTSHRYYLTSELSQRINLIRHLIENSEQLLLVLAEKHGGKTALLNQLRRIAEKECQHWWIYTPDTSPALSSEVLLSSILNTFHVRHDGKPFAILQDTLRNHIAATRYNGQIPVLFVDDAHQLPLATLKFLIELNMQGKPPTRMRVVLFCEPQITSILAAPEFKMVQNTLIHTLDVPVFSDTQVRDYLQFRLHDTRYNNIHPFHSEVIKKIYERSEGLAGKINIYAQQILQQFAEQRHDIHLPHTFAPQSKSIWGVAIALVVVGLSLLFYWKSIEEKQTSVPIFQPIATVPYIVPTEVKVEAEKKETEKPKEIPEKRVKEADWLSVQNPNNYTLQILGTHELRNLQKFTKRYSDITEFAMFKTTYRNKDWYVLVYGIYSSRTEAQAALQNMPAELRNTKPWIRGIASVQGLIE
ncbi:AAA family ATPase [Candidatus Marithrix sp. Canyon 246]|uniref:AAA family ATPase n=1 Tax=Candidatus Marithrix sp. Canyon 246 TaxID=1827136 RepID=UPI00084A29E4|nr:AAA family ATPase [Candidatus Marithrix sp. Canyon 246]